MAKRYKYYKSFLEEWLAVEEGTDANRVVWHSYNGFYFYPLKVSSSRNDSVCVEYYRGARYWQAHLQFYEKQINLSYLNGRDSANRPIFRLQDWSRLNVVVFDGNKDYRVIRRLDKVVKTGHLICVSSLCTMAKDTIRLYLGKPGKMELCKIVSVVDSVIETDRGVLVNYSSWEGLNLMGLKFEDYYIAETDEGISIIEK